MTHSQCCICCICMSKRRASGKGGLKPPSHIRFQSPPKTPSAPKCQSCQTNVAWFSSSMNKHFAYCPRCHWKMQWEKARAQINEAELKQRREREEESTAASKIKNNGQRIEQFRSILTHIPFKPVQIGYAVNRFSQKLGSIEEKLFPGYSNMTPCDKREKCRKFLFDNFSEVLSIQQIFQEWFCCQNRFEAVDLSRYWSLRCYEQIDEDGEPSGITDASWTDSSSKKKRKMTKTEANSDPAEGIHGGTEPGVTTSSDGRQKDVAVIDTADTEMIKVLIGKDNAINYGDEVGTECIAATDRNHDLDQEKDKETEAGTAGSESQDACRPSEDTLDISIPEVNLYEQPKGDPKSKNRPKCRPGKRHKCSVKLKKARPQSAKQSGLNLESEYVFTPDSASSSLHLTPSSSDSESDSSRLRNVIGSERENESSPSGSDSGNVLKSIVILETVDERAQKVKEGRKRSQEWERLAAEREKFEERTLGQIEFGRAPLEYAVEVIIKTLGWDRFPFGARVLNNGKISRTQLRDPNSGEWAAIKEEFVRKHFKTALSITPFKGNWLCCKNRTDALDIPAYLRDYWKIGLK